MENVLIVIHLLLAIALILVVLMQRTAADGGGLVGGGGSSTMGGLFTARGSANLLTRTTAILATLFIGTSLLLGIVASHQHKARSLAEQIAPLEAPATPETKTEKPVAPAETPAAPAAPEVPVAQ